MDPLQSEDLLDGDPRDAQARLLDVLKNKNKIYNAWGEEAEKRPLGTSHVLLFDMTDVFAIEALLTIAKGMPTPEMTRLTESIEEAVKNQTLPRRTQPLFSTENLFLETARNFKEDFSMKPGHFCVLFFAYKGVSAFWFPILLVPDGPHRKRGK